MSDSPASCSTCVVYGTNACVATVNAAENTARTILPGWLDAVYNNIRSHAPSARVVVLGYPRFYHDVWYCIGLSSTPATRSTKAPTCSTR